MKKGKVCLWVLVGFTCLFMEISRVDAASEQINFYFFSEASTTKSSKDDLINKINSASYSTNSFVYDIPSNGKKEAEGWVRLSSNGDTSAKSTSSWSLDTFWTQYQRAYRSLTSSNGTGVYINSSANNYHYQLHGSWKDNVAGDEFDVKSQLDLTKFTAANLSKASIIPTIDTSTKFSVKSGLINVNINRKISKSSYNIDSYKAINASGKNYVLLPALYYITYSIPDGEVATYKITQHYYDKATKKEIQASKVMGSDYKTGSSYTVTCPSSIGDYKLSSNASTKITINGTDGRSDCYYTKNTSSGNGNVPDAPQNLEQSTDNPTTSDIPIYIVWLVGIGALGYASYYYSKYCGNKEK